MAAFGKGHAEHFVARLEHSSVGGKVCLRTGVRLHVGVFGAEQRLGALDGDVFHDVHTFAAAVVAFAGVAFGVFIGQHAAHRRHDGGRDNVFGSDQFQFVLLAVEFERHRVADFRIDVFHITNDVKQIVVHMKSYPFQHLIRNSEFGIKGRRLRRCACYSLKKCPSKIIDG